MLRRAFTRYRPPADQTEYPHRAGVLLGLSSRKRLPGERSRPAARAAISSRRATQGNVSCQLCQVTSNLAMIATRRPNIVRNQATSAPLRARKREPTVIGTTDMIV